MKTRGIIVGGLIGPGVLGLLTALSLMPGEVKSQPSGGRKLVASKNAERRTPGGVALDGRCSPTMGERVDDAQRIATGQNRPGRVVYVLCGPDGNAYRTVLEYQDPTGTRFASGYQAAKFFGALSTPTPVRVDLFEADGRRTGYVILDRKTGHVDFYDGGSRWTGSGAADLASGEVQRFDVEGRRQGSTTLPVLPDGEKRTGARITRSPRLQGAL
jgi:hypothetical protein